MKEKEDESFMIKVATFIVDRRNLFFLIFGVVFKQLGESGKCTFGIPA